MEEYIMKNLRPFTLGDITLKDNFFRQVTQKDIDFLNTFDVDRLLYNFRLTAGLPGKASGPYNGWENTRIGGHTLGHYLAAAAQACAGGYGECKGHDGLTLSQRLASLISGLAECQAAGGSGFIFGATMDDPSKPQLQFDKMEAGDYSDTWVPWYTMHKIVNGLVETAKLAGGQTARQALEVAEKLGEWIYKRTSRWTDQQRNNVLAVEYGAMNDCLYELYKCARAAGYEDAEHFLQAAHTFDEEILFEEVLAAARPAGKADILNNKHANCTIPKFLGAINRYLTLGDEKYLAYSEAFWTLVTERHTYITGGNSECEHFGRDNILDAERSNCNCETCNTHNMLKLTRTLFMLTGQRKYSDYYENTFINAILASVNRETGMTTYFQPMATGCFKTYCNIDVNKNYFWCCTGTGLENFTKLGDSIYFYDEDTLYVNLYVSSEVKWQEKKVSISQTSKMPEEGNVEFTINCDEKDGSSFTLALRIPDWAAGVPGIMINGRLEEAGNSMISKEGWLFISRNWKNGDKVILTLAMKIAAYSLPDNPRCFAFKYGPVVLAAELGRDDKMSLRQVGVQCDVCANKIVRGLELALNGNYGGTSGLKPLASETLLVNEPLEEFMKRIEKHFERLPGTLTFVLHDTDWQGRFVFSPYYQINNQRYGIYWLFTDSPEEIKMLNEMAKAEKAACGKANYIEGIGVGYGAQTEGNENTWPHFREEGSGSVADPHQLTRYAKAGGSFSYMFKVLPDEDKTIYLDCTFLAEDEGKEIIIKAGDILIAEYKVDGKISVSFELPKKVTKGQKEVRISFSGKPGKASARLAAPVSTSWI